MSSKRKRKQPPKFYRAREIELPYFTTEENLVYCNDVRGIIQKMDKNMMVCYCDITGTNMILFPLDIQIL